MISCFFEDVSNLVFFKPHRNTTREDIGISPEEYNELFGSKEIDGRQSATNDDDGEPVCGRVQRIIFPQMAKTQSNQWLYVVNEVAYTQAVTVDICEKPGQPCAHMNNLPHGMFSRCKQQFAFKKMLALHPTEKRTYPEVFKFPSCCTCYVEIIDDFFSRSNGRTVSNRNQSPAVRNRSPSGSLLNSDNSTLVSTNSSDSSPTTQSSSTEASTTVSSPTSDAPSTTPLVVT